MWKEIKTTQFWYIPIVWESFDCHNVAWLVVDCWITSHSTSILHVKNIIQFTLLTYTVWFVFPNIFVEWCHLHGHVKIELVSFFKGNQSSVASFYGTAKCFSARGWVKNDEKPKCQIIFSDPVCSTYGSFAHFSLWKTVRTYAEVHQGT